MPVVVGREAQGVVGLSGKHVAGTRDMCPRLVLRSGSARGRVFDDPATGTFADGFT